VKRVDLRNQLLDKFNEAKERSSSKLKWMDRNVHSSNVMLLGAATCGYLAYSRSTLIG